MSLVCDFHCRGTEHSRSSALSSSPLTVRTPCIVASKNSINLLLGPKEETVGQIKEFQKLFLAPGFLSYISVLITISLVIVFYFAPKYGKTNMIWYITVCSLIGGISVSVTTGLGAAIVQTAMGDNQVCSILSIVVGIN